MKQRRKKRRGKGEAKKFPTSRGEASATKIFWSDAGGEGHHPNPIKTAGKGKELDVFENLESEWEKKKKKKNQKRGEEGKRETSENTSS